MAPAKTDAQKARLVRFRKHNESLVSSGKQKISWAEFERDQRENDSLYAELDSRTNAFIKKERQTLLREYAQK